jgi:hypothetical protein
MVTSASPATGPRTTTDAQRAAGEAELVQQRRDVVLDCLLARCSSAPIWRLVSPIGDEVEDVAFLRAQPFARCVEPRWNHLSG